MFVGATSDIEYKSLIDSKIKEYGLEDDVIFTGMINKNVEKYYSAFDFGSGCAGYPDDSFRKKQKNPAVGGSRCMADRNQFRAAEKDIHGSGPASPAGLSEKTEISRGRKG